MQTWPTILPAPDLTFSNKTDESTLRTQNMIGHPVQRQRFTHESRTYQAQWVMTDFEFGLFQSFVLRKLHNGNDWFQIDLTVGGSGLKTVVARLVDGNYTYDHKDVLNWTVKASLQTDQQIVMSEEDFEIATSFDPDVPLAWPTQLPGVTAAFSGKPETPVKRVTMSSGRTVQRKHVTNELRTYFAAWSMNDTQFGIFQAFLLYKLKNGAEYFNIDLPVGTGYGFETVSVQIVMGDYSAQRDNTGQWLIKVSLSVEDALVFSEDVFDYFLAGGEIDGLEAAESRLHYVLNDTIPLETPL